MNKVRNFLFCIIVSSAIALSSGGILSVFAEDGRDTGTRPVTGDTTITFTNEKSGAVPTGIITNMIPGYVVFTVGSGILLLLKRKDSEHE